MREEGWEVKQRKKKKRGLNKDEWLKLGSSLPTWMDDSWRRMDSGDVEEVFE